VKTYSRFSYFHELNPTLMRTQLLAAGVALLISTTGFAQTYTGAGDTIVDNGVINIPLNVSGLTPANIDSVNFGLETVCIDLTHTWDSDLEIRIVSPDGTTALLVSGIGGSDDNYTNTCFNSYASSSITSGSAPFTGTFRPMGQLGLVNNGQNGNGTWYLRVTDTYPADAGLVLSWNITFGNNPATAIPFTDSNLPLVIINTNNQTIVDDPKIMVDFGIIYNGVGNRNNMTDPWNNYNGKAGVEYRGSSSQSAPKKPIGIELWDVNGNAIDSSLLGMPKESDWILIANYYDKSLLNNTLTYHLASEMGWYAARHQHVELIINGEYQGVYILMEKIKRDNNRVDIANLQVTDIAGDDVTGGYIVKIDKGTGSGGAGWTSSFAPDTAVNNQTIYFQYEYPSEFAIVPQQETYIQAYIDSFETALAGPNFMDTTVGYPHFIDVNSFVDFFLINEVSRNVDGYRLSTYLHKDKNSNGGKLTIGPVWDFDLGWANANYCNGSDTTGWAYDFAANCPGDYWQIPFWWDRLLQDPAFQDKVKCRWEELSQTALSVNYIHSYCDSMAVYLNESQQRNFTAWPILGIYVWPNPSPIPTTYQGEIDELKNWYVARFTWMDTNMPGTLNGCNIASVNETSGSQNVNAYPNPFSNTINLSIYLPQNENVQIEVVNVMGQTVQPMQTIQHNGGTQVISLNMNENLPAGIYLIRITAGGHVWTSPVTRMQ
jgi:subtilisin-like proprotein convertase family protein